MRAVFVDTNYWVARFHQKDQLHEKAKELSTALAAVRLVTTDEVLVCLSSS